MIPQYSPERMVDREMIRDILGNWARSVDRLDYDGMRLVFHSDAIDEHGVYNGDIDGLLEWLREAQKPIFSAHHMLGNILIEFSTENLAVVETYISLVQRSRSSGVETAGTRPDDVASTDTMLRGRYIDRFERRDGIWAIAHRNTILDSITSLPVPTAMDRLPVSNPGHRNGNDAIFAIRERAGL